MRYIMILVFACISLCYAYETVNAEKARYPFSKGGFNVNAAATWGNEVFTGNVFFVDSGDSNARDDTAHGMKRAPYATMDFADGLCTANNGDIVIVLPGHVETAVEAAGLDLNTAGVTWRGVGLGSSRPTVNFTTVVGADMNIDGANITMINFLFTGGFDALTGPVDINAADCSLINVETRDVTGEATDFVVCDGNADRLLIDGWIHRGATGDGGDSALLFANVASTCDDVIIRNFDIYGNFDTGAIENTGFAVLRISIGGGRGWNYIWTEGSEDICVALVSTATGYLGPNIAARLQDNAANLGGAFVGDDCQFMSPIQIVNADGERSTETTQTQSDN